MAEANVSTTDESKPGRTPKKRRPFLTFLSVLLLLAGLLFGIHASGGMDLRPFIYPVVPKIPYVGETLAGWMRIPERYSFTPEQRRRLELEEWEQAIAQRTRSLDKKETNLGALSKDLNVRKTELRQGEKELQKQLEALSSDLAAVNAEKPSEQEVKRLLRSFEDMSPRNAAAILEKTSDQLAVTLLSQMGEDIVAKILAKMAPDRAARLTEALSEPR